MNTEFRNLFRGLARSNQWFSSFHDCHTTFHFYHQSLQRKSFLLKSKDPAVSQRLFLLSVLNTCEIQRHAFWISSSFCNRTKTVCYVTPIACASSDCVWCEFSFNKSSNSWFSNFWLSDEVQNELPNRNFLCEIM